jgi:hypothetical protein
LLAPLLPWNVAAADRGEESLKLVRLRNGMNAVDVNVDGRDDSVVVARRENFNAHGFDVTTIYIWAAADKGRELELQIVPLQSPNDAETKEDEREKLTLSTSGGADCLLEDFRLLTDAAAKTAVVITAERTMGNSFADKQRVVFKHYRLKRNADGIPGWPLLYFERFKRHSSKERYCDVGDAFKKELGIGRDGRPGADGEVDDSEE